MRLNVANKPDAFTHEGGRAFPHLKPEQELRRSVLACMLWEREFYESGQAIADRIADLAEKCSPQYVADLAIEARSTFNLRHVPLLLLSIITKTGAGSSLVADAIEATIQRADELTEFVAIYWRDGRRPLSAQAKKGLARAFRKFNAYHLAKYNRDGAIKLCDVMFMVKPKPRDDEQAEVFQKLANKKLEAPDTWEVAFSGGADKKETFERLLSEGKLGYLALLRNLRKMDEVGVDHALIKETILERKGAGRVLPFRFIAAARAAPMFEPVIDQALVANLSGSVSFKGKTVALVDVSGSMTDILSSRSDMTRMDAAAGLAAMLVGENVRMFSFSDHLCEAPYRLGMAGVDAIINSQPHCGTHLGLAVRDIGEKVGGDRLIVISDEQSRDAVPAPKEFSSADMINVASAQNGVGYGNGWTAHITGFSEAVLRYIQEMESSNG